MKVRVNGKTLGLKDGETLAGLIAGKKLDAGRVLASVNKEIIKAGTFSQVVLAEGDEVELFAFVSGG
ncbi:MAG: sulfur carrier protein ThiS [Victivallaceae bacterium]|nr:sulfur carrier protein ThiS [Victivallaceae bacterium]